MLRPARPIAVTLDWQHDDTTLLPRRRRLQTIP